MENQLENPVIKDSDVEEKFLEAARLADAGKEIPAELVPGAKADPPTATEPKADKPEENDKPDNSETDPEKDDRPRDEKGRFTKTKDGQDIPEAERKPAEQLKETKPAATQPNQPSDYEAKKQERAAKEKERLDRTWENVNRQKEELEQRRKELAAEEQRIRQQVQRPQVQPQQRQYSSKELFEAHQDFKTRAKEALKTGDYDAFNENEALAEQALQHAQQFYQIEQKEAQQTQFQKWNESWRGNAQKVIESDPELANPETPLGKQVAALMESHGQVFWMIPDGFAKAVEIAKLRLDAGSASELREANKKLQAEVERLNGLTGISGSGPTSQPAPKKFEELSSEEQEQRLMQAAAAIDESRN